MQQDIYKTKVAVMPQLFHLILFNLLCQLISMQSAEGSTYNSHFIMLQNGKVHTSCLQSFSSLFAQLHRGSTAYRAGKRPIFFLRYSIHYLTFKDLAVTHKQKHFDVCVLCYRKLCSEQVPGKSRGGGVISMRRDSQATTTSPSIIREVLREGNGVKQRLYHMQRAVLSVV